MVQYENPVTTPAPSQTLALSQAPMLNDFQYLKAFGNQDHNFSSDTANSNDGYHKLIHMLPQVQPGAAIANTGQLYSNATQSIGGGVQLWYVDDSLNITQLTNKARASNGVSGWASLPGGMLMQWGVATGATDTDISFTNSNGKPFAAVYSLQITVFENNNRCPPFRTS